MIKKVETASPFSCLVWLPEVNTGHNSTGEGVQPLDSPAEKQGQELSVEQTWQLPLLLEDCYQV